MSPSNNDYIPGRSAEGFTHTATGTCIFAALGTVTQAAAQVLGSPARTRYTDQITVSECPRETALHPVLCLRNRYYPARPSNFLGLSIDFGPRKQ